jgi:hypothetical protein
MLSAFIALCHALASFFKWHATACEIEADWTRWRKHLAISDYFDEQQATITALLSQPDAKGFADKLARADSLRRRLLADAGFAAQHCGHICPAINNADGGSAGADSGGSADASG